MRSSSAFFRSCVAAALLVAACGSDESTTPQVGGSGGTSGGSGGASGAGNGPSMSGSSSGGWSSGGWSSGGWYTGGAAGSTGGTFDFYGGAPSTGGVVTVECGTDLDCASGQVCVGATEGPTCIPGGCVGDESCTGDTYCYRGECVVHREYGESCGWEHKCRPGLECVLQVCTDPLRVNSPCNAPCKDEGRRCFTDDQTRPFCVPETTKCADGTVCQRQEYCERPDDAGAWRCARRGSYLAPCEDDSMCALGYFCDAGRCGLKGGGEPCSVDADCGQENYCAASTFAPGQRVCTGRHLPLEPCGASAGTSSDSGCVWGFQCDGAAHRCEPLVMPLCEGGCPFGYLCGTGLRGGECRRSFE